MASELRIAGIIRLHKFEEEIELVLNSLAGHCTDLFLLTCDMKSERMIDAVVHVPKLHRIQEASKPWTQAGSLEAGMRMVDDLKPDVVLFPDEDELFPDNLADEIAEWRKVWDRRPTMSFSAFQCIDNPGRILMEHLYRQAPHCKALKWSPRISYAAGYAGWCWPSSLYKQKKYACPYPLRHMAYMTEAQRIGRLATHNGASSGDREWYSKKYFHTADYDSSLTWEEWCNRTGPYMVELSSKEALELKTVWDLLRLVKTARRSEAAEKMVGEGRVRIDGVRMSSIYDPLPRWNEKLQIQCGRREACLKVIT